MENISKVSFKDKSIRETNDIELLREVYEELLMVYQEEIKDRVHLEMRIEGIIEENN